MMLAVLSALGNPARAQSGTATGEETHPPRFQAQLAESAEDSGEAPHCFGILGRVCRPGVYSTDRPQIGLSEVVAAAGGPTPDAGKLVRVVRNGSERFRLSYRPGGNDLLLAGDLVIFDSATADSTSRAAAGNSLRTPESSSSEIGIAFVGIHPGQPAVISLPVSIATIPQVLQALHQSPALAQSVKVIRTSQAGPPVLAGQLPHSLVEGDVLVFDAARINYELLSRAEAFPEPFPMTPGLPRVSLPAPIEIASRNAAARQSSTTAEAADTTLGVVIQPGHRGAASTDEPGDVEAATRPSVGLDAASAEPAAPGPFVGAFPGSDDGTATALEELHLDADPDGVITAAWSAPPKRRFSQSGGPLFELHEPDGLPGALIDEAPGSKAGARSAASPLKFADASAAENVSPAQKLADSVPAPEGPAEGASPGIARRAWKLGLSVLLLGAICFAVSLLWFRLEDATGLPPAHGSEMGEESSRRSLSSRSTLDRLIENRLPIIEEVSLLPEDVEYHGEAVGKARIRLDASHPLAGPHFAVAAEQTLDGAPAVEQTKGSRGQQFRIDPVAAETTRPPRNSGATTEQRRTGLLDRVLVAMEREKRG
jgi:hypothetical protein